MNITMLGSGSWKSSLSYRIIALGQQLGQLGWTVKVMVPAADKYNGFKPDPSPKAEGISIIQPWQPATTSPILNLIPYLATSLAALLRTRPDIVYLYKPTPITILGLLPRLLFGTPVILDLDDLGSQVMKAEGQSRLQAELVHACELLAMRFSTAIVVASAYLQQRVAAQYPNKPVLVLSNGVDIAQYPRRQPASPRPTVYYFGAVNRLSLIEPLLRAMPSVLRAEPATQLNILGGGSALEEAKELVRELGVEGAVHFSGWIPMDDVQRYTQFADIAVCYQPDTETVRAASNMKVFQYMAMGSVPIVSDVGGLSQYVRHGSAGVVVPAGDSAALAAAIGDVLKSPHYRTRLATAARQLAETQYAWPVLARQLSAFLGTIQAVRVGRLRRKLS